MKDGRHYNSQHVTVFFMSIFLIIKTFSIGSISFSINFIENDKKNFYTFLLVRRVIERIFFVQIFVKDRMYEILFDI